MGPLVANLMGTLGDRVPRCDPTERWPNITFIATARGFVLFSGYRFIIITDHFPTRGTGTFQLSGLNLGVGLKGTGFPCRDVLEAPPAI